MLHCSQMEICPAFVDETGILTESVKKQPVYGIGLLVVPDTREITDRFYGLHFNFFAERAAARINIRKAIRARATLPTLQEIDHLMHSTRHHEYKFADANRYNMQQYIDLLNLYFSCPGLEFHALVLDRTEPEAGLSKWNDDEWEAYTHFAHDLLESALTRDVFAIVDLQSKPRRSKTHLEDVLCSVDAVKGCLRATSDMSIYLQLVDVLLGCVQFDYKDRMGYYGKTKRSAEKRMLVNLVKSQLGLREQEPFMREGEALSRWEGISSSFTVRKGQW